MIAKHGSIEAVRLAQAQAGKTGGNVQTKKGFAVTGTAKEAANRRWINVKQNNEQHSIEVRKV